jgi:hypothetical protein
MRAPAHTPSRVGLGPASTGPGLVRSEPDCPKLESATEPDRGGRPSARRRLAALRQEIPQGRRRG